MAAAQSRAFTYVLPLRMTGDESEREELTTYLEQLSQWCADVVVVDGSAPAVFAHNARRWRPLVRHMAPDPAHTSLMGKVPGVLTGLDTAQHERVIIADDDVRYGPSELERTIALLDRFDLVRPQNYFAPLPWHAVWDTARTLLNRAWGSDFPGTLGVRRSRLRECGGYDGNVLFENLELIRTVRAHGGTAVAPLDLYVRRRPPTTTHFWAQRTRQAYDDFAFPLRMTLWLSVVPILVWSAARRKPESPGTLAGLSIGLAELGRRSAGGTAVFPALSSAMAPLWVTERGVCAWLAVVQRLRYGGVRYGDSVIRVAAHSTRELRRRAGARGPGSGGPMPMPDEGPNRPDRPKSVPFVTVTAETRNA
jgi:hypothetical protein